MASRNLVIASSGVLAGVMPVRMPWPCLTTPKTLPRKPGTKATPAPKTTMTSMASITRYRRMTRVPPLPGSETEREFAGATPRPGVRERGDEKLALFSEYLYRSICVSYERHEREGNSMLLPAAWVPTRNCTEYHY